MKPPSTLRLLPAPTQMHLCRLIRFVLLAKPFAPLPRLYFSLSFCSPSPSSRLTPLLSDSQFLSSCVFFPLITHHFLSLTLPVILALFSWGSTRPARRTASSCTARPRWRRALTRQRSSSGSGLCRKWASAPGSKNPQSRSSSCCRTE